jgi:hypothetical protein
MSCVRTFATFRIFSKTLSVNEISEIVGVKPTKATNRNVDARRAAEREFTVWTLSSKASLDLVDEHEHINFLLNSLAGSVRALARLRDEGCSMDVFCYFETDGQGGPSLTHVQMRTLSDLGLDIAWDLYIQEQSQGSRENREK